MSNTQGSARPYFRTPTISPDGAQVAFVYAGDIWLASIEGGDAERLTANPAGHSSPRWSPDGSQIAFSSSRTGQGDIYVLPLSGGDLRRVTYHDIASVVEDWSPDGDYIFFSSGRDQQGSAIYRVAAEGGTPIPWISQPYENLNSLAVAPDGQALAFNNSRDRWWRRGPNPYGGADIWLVGSAAGALDFRKVSDYTGMNRWPLWAPDGAGLYFISDRDGMENLWFQPLEAGAARQLTDFGEGRMLWPAISRDGRTIVFERDFGIWRMDLDSGAIAPLTIRVRPDTKFTPVRVVTYSRELTELELSPDGKKVAFVARGEIFADFADKETDKEQRQGPSFRVTNTHFRESNLVWSPDSRKLAYTSDRHGDEELFLYDFATQAETRLVDNAQRAPGRTANPRYSPDGKWIAYALGDDQIRLLDAETHADRPFVSANFTYGASFAWSPDSQWIVFIAQDERFFSNLYVQRLDEDRPRQITFLSNLQAHGPLWAPNGRFIVFTTSQYRAESQIARVDLRPQSPQFREAEFEKLFETKGTGNRSQATEKVTERTQDVSDSANQSQKHAESSPPSDQPEEKPIDQEATEQIPTPNPQLPTPNPEIVFDGIERRLRFLTPTQMDAGGQCISPDSRDLIFSASVAGKSNLWTMPLDEPRQDQPPRQLTSGPSGKGAAQFAPDGKSFYFLESGQIMIRKFPSGDQIQLPVSADVTIDFNQEKRQIFHECWRMLRDRFYDPTFRGLDWSAARDQFAPLADGAQTPSELYQIINLMVGELRASHLGAGGGYWSIQHGYTGLLFDPVEQATTGRLKIAAIIPDSPAALAGDGTPIQVGDELLAVDAVELSPKINLDSLLQRTIGRRVRLRIASNSPSQASIDAEQSPSPNQHSPSANREVAIRPISADQYDDLRYRDWVYTNEAYVHRVSGGRLGYVHIREMSYRAYQQFLADLDTETHGKQGVVLDVRFNSGGHTATFILDVLARQSVLLSAFRDRPSTDAGHLAGNRVLNKPTVLVINERCFSNTEMFTEGYRRLRLGKVVGRPTGGAVIWTFGMRLLDGTYFSVPRFKVATPEGEDLEGTGRAVDLDVPLPLGATVRGSDPQLDTAVSTLLAQIDGIA
ncbi:MAG TPA: S41 family peptidase [Roseiflexaceae bacterium]|nr:S41 family peptidase [Roseiflexaceae bacterium]